MKKVELNDPDYDPNYDIIIDIMEMQNKFSEEAESEMRRYIGISKSFQTITRMRKVAFLTNTPDQVVNMYIYKSIDDRNNEFGVFSTLDAALDWLGIQELDLRSE